jgi:hypothetical protein
MLITLSMITFIKSEDTKKEIPSEMPNFLDTDFKGLEGYGYIGERNNHDPIIIGLDANVREDRAEFSLGKFPIKLRGLKKNQFLSFDYIPGSSFSFDYVLFHLSPDLWVNSTDPYLDKLVFQIDLSDIGDPGESPPEQPYTAYLPNISTAWVSIGPGVTGLASMSRSYKIEEFFKFYGNSLYYFPLTNSFSYPHHRGAEGSFFYGFSDFFRDIYENDIPLSSIIKIENGELFYKTPNSEKQQLKFIVGNRNLEGESGSVFMFPREKQATIFNEGYVEYYSSKGPIKMEVLHEPDINILFSPPRLSTDFAVKRISNYALVSVAQGGSVESSELLKIEKIGVSNSGEVVEINPSIKDINLRINDCFDLIIGKDVLSKITLLSFNTFEITSDDALVFTSDKESKEFPSISLFKKQDSKKVRVLVSCSKNSHNLEKNKENYLTEIYESLSSESSGGKEYPNNLDFTKLNQIYSNQVELDSNLIKIETLDIDISDAGDYKEKAIQTIMNPFQINQIVEEKFLRLASRMPVYQ